MVGLRVGVMRMFVRVVMSVIMLVCVIMPQMHVGRWVEIFVG